MYQIRWLEKDLNLNLNEREIVLTEASMVEAYRMAQIIKYKKNVVSIPCITIKN